MNESFSKEKGQKYRSVGRARRKGKKNGNRDALVKWRKSSCTCLLAFFYCSMGGCGEDFVGGNVTRLLHRLEHEGLQRIRMFTMVCLVYVVFWGPLFLTVVFGGQSGQHQSEGRGLASVGPPKDPLSHQVTLYICFAHAFVNPTVLLALHSGLRHQAAGMSSLLCCCCCIPLTASPSPQEDSSPDRLAGFGPRIQLPPIPTDYDIDYGRIINYNGVPSFLSPLPDRVNHQQHVQAASRPM